MNIDKIKKELTEPVYNHLTGLSVEQLDSQKIKLISDMELIGQPGYFRGNCNELYRIRQIELNFINYLLS
jgi:hypothetical protein